MSGLLDFLNTPTGMGLLSGVASYAMNAQRGTPVNNIGRGLAGGLAGYQAGVQGIQDAENRKAEQAYRQVMMDAQMMNATTAKRNAEIKAQKALEDAKRDAKAFERVFNVPMQIQQVSDEEYDLMPAGYQSDFIDIKDATQKPSPQFQVNEQMAKMYGLTPEDVNFLSGLYQMDPKEAAREMRAIRAANRKGVAEAKDVLAKERAIADAIGIDVGTYLKNKMDKPGQQIVVNNYGEPKAVQLPDGSQGLVRFPKDPNAPPIVTPFTPPASDTEQMTAGYAARMESAEEIIQQIGDKGNPTWGTAAIGAIAGEPGRGVVMTAEQQKHRQAQEDWVRAKLRKESGAVIGDEEMEREIRTYFPTPWDKPETIEQKAKARETAIKAMQKTAGPAKPMQKPSAAKPQAGKQIKRTGTLNGRKVIEYTDGSIVYAD